VLEHVRLHRRAPVAVLEGVAVDAAVGYSLTQLKRLQQMFPHKPIVVAEIGWPSRGRTASRGRLGCQRGAVSAPLPARANRSSSSIT